MIYSSFHNLKGSPIKFRSGFTLLELLIALSILSISFVVIWSTFSGVIKAWERGTDLLNELRHGDYVMEQVVSALRSTAFFKTAPGKYGFHLESGSAGSYPGDRVSWVTAHPAFMPPDSELGRGLHRIVISIEDNKKGDPGFAVRAFSHFSDLGDEDTDPWFVSSEVKGIECRTFDPESEDWETDWEDTNTIPSLVEITLYMDPIEKYGPPVKLSQAIEIPVALPVTNAIPLGEEPIE